MTDIFLINLKNQNKLLKNVVELFDKYKYRDGLEETDCDTMVCGWDLNRFEKGKLIIHFNKSNCFIFDYLMDILPKIFIDSKLNNFLLFFLDNKNISISLRRFKSNQYQCNEEFNDYLVPIKVSIILKAHKNGIGYRIDTNDKTYRVKEEDNQALFIMSPILSNSLITVEPSESIYDSERIVLDICWIKKEYDLPNEELKFFDDYIKERILEYLNTNYVKSPKKKKNTFTPFSFIDIFEDIHQ